MSKRSRVPPSRRFPSTIFALPVANEYASPAVRLGLQIRAAASMSGCCACGGRAEHYLLVDEEEGVLVRIEEPSRERGATNYTEIIHAHDCPAVSPAVLAAVAASTPKEEERDAS
jgi:hypothetical protein